MTKQEIIQQLRDIAHDMTLPEGSGRMLVREASERLVALAGAIEFDMDTEAELEGEALVEDTF